MSQADQLLRRAGGSGRLAGGLVSSQLYQAQVAVASSISTSPATSFRASSWLQSPRVSTVSTPAVDRATPHHCWREMRAPYSNRPSPSMKMGMLEPTSVTLSGVEVLSAMYCSAL